MNLIAPILRRFGYAPIRRSARSFNAAGVNRLTADWSTTPISLNSLLISELDAMRARIDDLATRNNPYLVKFVTMVLSNVLGHEGITLKNKASDPVGFKNGEIVPGRLDKLANRLIEDEWWNWGKKENCTVAKNATWLESNQLGLRTASKHGETIWRMVTGADAKNKYNFAIQPIATSRIDTSRNENLSDGGSIRTGIQCDSAGTTTHVWLYDSDPADTLFSVGGRRSKPYPYADFVHPFISHEIGQRRGFPWAAPALIRTKMLDGYEEAHLEGTRAAACKMGFITEEGDSQYAGPDAPDGGKYMDAEPGTIERLLKGQSFQPADWGYPNGGYGEFVKDCLRGISAGLGVSYNTLANDLEGVNFSSGRLGLMDEREMWKVLQSWWWTNFCTPIFSRWLENSLLSGAIALELPSGEKKPLPMAKRSKFDQPCWHGRRWQWVDPTKEVAAKESEMSNYMTSPTRVIAELGGDEDEFLQESSDFLKKCEALGLPKPRWALEAKAADTAERVAQNKVEAADEPQTSTTKKET